MESKFVYKDKILKLILIPKEDEIDFVQKAFYKKKQMETIAKNFLLKMKKMLINWK